MNTNNAQNKAKKRLKGLFSSCKGNEKDMNSQIKWDINKTYSFMFHDKSKFEQDILLNLETFQGLQVNDIIELSSSNPEIKLIFKIRKENLIEKNKIPISLLSTYNDLIKSQIENSKSPTQFFVKLATISEYFLDKITLIFNENFISRKDLFVVTQSLIGDVVYLNKKIRLYPKSDNQNDIDIGKIVNFKCSKFKNPQGMTGIVTSSTDFNLRSSASCVYFLIEIAKETFDFTICSKVRYELILEFIKNTLQELRKSNCDHTINIIFYSRIILNKKEILRINFNKRDNFFFDIVYNLAVNRDDCFFDLYSQIAKINLKKFDIIETIEKLNKAFLKFGVIFRAKNLFEYISLIKDDYSVYTNIEGHKYEEAKSSRNANNDENFMGNQRKNESFNFNQNNFFYFNEIYSLKFLQQIRNFKIAKSTNSNMFEAINIMLNDIKNEKEKIFKLGNMLTVISSGDYFPYYNHNLAKITKENIYQQGIACSLILLTEKKKSELYQNNSATLYDTNDISNEIFNLHNYTIYKNSNLSEYERERGYSCYAKDFSELNETNIKIAIDRNYDIIKSLDPNKCLRKNSCDNAYKDITNFNTYSFNPDTFTHKSPKWLKLFYISPCYFYKKSKEESRIIFNNTVLSKIHRNNCPVQLNFLNKDSNNTSNIFHSQISWEIQNYPSPPISLPLFLENDIFNSKKNEKAERRHSRDNKNINNINYQVNQVVVPNKALNINKNEEKQTNTAISNREMFNEYAGLVHENKRYSLAINESEAPVFNKNEQINPENLRIEDSILLNYQNLIKKNVDEVELEDIENYYNIIKPKKKNSLEEKQSITNIINTKPNKKLSTSAETNIKDSPNDISNSRNNYNNSNTAYNNKNEAANKTRDSADINNNVNSTVKKLSNTSPFENSPNMNSNNNKNRQSLITNSLTINNDYNNQNNYNGDEEMEFFKKTFEFDQQIFRLNKSNKKQLEEFSKELKLDLPETTNSTRNVLTNFEFTEGLDDFECFIELIKEIPLLPIFGDFNPNEKRDDVAFFPYSISTLNSETNIFDEMIYERINNNYQIVKTKNQFQEYNNIVDLSKTYYITLFDRRFYHIIIAEDQNYKVEIYNYSKKQDIYSPKRETGAKGNYLYDQDLKGFEYRYFTYDYFYSFFFSKRYINNYNEKNEVFWSNYDVQFIDLKHNMKKLKFKNELNFLLIDYPNSYNSKKSTTNKNLPNTQKNRKNKNCAEEKCLSLNKMDSEKTNEESAEIDELNLDLKNSKYFAQQESEENTENQLIKKKIKPQKNRRFIE